MADMDVERGDRSVWPWVLLGLLVLGVVTWALVLALGNFIQWPWVLLGLLVTCLTVWAVAQALGPR